MSILRALTESSYIKLLEIFESVFDKLLETLKLEARVKPDPLCKLDYLLGSLDIPEIPESFETPANRELPSLEFPNLEFPNLELLTATCF